MTLRDLRVRLGLSMSEAVKMVAERKQVHIFRTTVASWEKGGPAQEYKLVPYAEMLRDLAAERGLVVNELHLPPMANGEEGS